MLSMGDVMIRRGFEFGLAPIESIRQTISGDFKTVILELTLTDGFTFTCSYQRQDRMRTIVPVITRRVGSDAEVK